MASSVIGALRVNLGLDSAQFNRGARQAESRAARLGSQMKKIGVAASVVGAGIALAIRGQLTAADELGKSAQALGVPVEALSQLQHAASMSGASLAGLETGLRRLSANMVDFPDKFADLGIAVRDANGEIRPTSDVMADLADVMESMPDGAEKTALAMDLMGRSGAELIPMLNGGAAGLREMMEEADRLGLTITEDTALAAAEFNDNLARLGGQMQGVVRIITAELVPILVRISDAVVVAAQKFAGLSDGQRRFAAAAAVVVVAIGPILIGLGFMLTGLTALAGPLGLAIIGFAAVGGVAAYVASEWDTLKQRFPMLQRMADIGASIKAAWDDLPSIRWALLIPALAWARFIPGLRWAAFIPQISWLALVGALRWGALIGSLSWAALGVIPVIGWVALAGGLAWSLLVKRIEWTGWIPSVVWADWVPRINWDDFLPDIDWGARFNRGGRAYEQGRALGQDLGAGATAGLFQASPDLDQATRDFLNSAEDAARDETETRSPSRVWMRLGQDLMGGLRDGVEAGSSEAVAAMAGAVQQVNAASEGLSWSSSVFGKISSSFGDLVADIATGSRKIGDVLKDLARQVMASGINKLVSGLFIGGPAGGVGSLLSSIFGGFRADGGPVSSGRSYVVGERGPELFTPGASGSITSNDDMVGRGGGINMPITIDARGADPSVIPALQAGIEQLRREVPAMIDRRVRHPDINYR